MTLTRSLLALPSTTASYKAATSHAFLASAGQLTLSANALQAWLTQDRLYALCGYSTFLGLLIAKCPAPAAGPLDAGSKVHRRRLTVLDREVGFFEEIARENGLALDSRPTDGSGGLGLLNPITRVRRTKVSALTSVSDPLPFLSQGYIDYMVAVASRGTFEEALILLWAMEKVRGTDACSGNALTYTPVQLYLDAWTFAAKQLPSPLPSSLAPGSSRALLSLIPNWSAPEFQAFVDDIAGLVDEIHVPLESDLGQRLVNVWETTLWFEERFWQAGGL